MKHIKLHKIKKHNHRTWQDLYYDGFINDQEEGFDEYTQIKVKNIDIWGSVKENEGFIEDYTDDWYMNMKNRSNGKEGN